MGLEDGSKIFTLNGKQLVIQANGLMTADSSIDVKELSKLVSAYKSYVAKTLQRKQLFQTFLQQQQTNHLLINQIGLLPIKIFLQNINLKI